MQVGIPIAYNVCEVKPDKIKHWVCVNREDFQLWWYIKIQVKSRTSFAHPITNPTFKLYFNIPSQLENPLCVHISNGLFYQVLLHIHCKQLGSHLAFYESIYVRTLFLNLGPDDDLDEVETFRPCKLHN